MKNATRIFINLLMYSLIIFMLLVLISLLIPTIIKISDIVLPSAVYPAITALSLTVFIIGSTKKPESQPVYTMGAIGIKFILSMVFAVIYFVVLKNTEAVYIILFFLLYLAFTVYLLRLIVKYLRINSLK